MREEALAVLQEEGHILSQGTLTRIVNDASDEVVEPKDRPRRKTPQPDGRGVFLAQPGGRRYGPTRRKKTLAGSEPWGWEKKATKSLPSLARPS